LLLKIDTRLCNDKNTHYNYIVIYIIIQNMNTDSLIWAFLAAIVSTTL